MYFECAQRGPPVRYKLCKMMQQLLVQLLLVTLAPVSSSRLRSSPIECDQSIYFFCRISNECLINYRICDGFYDCPHGEDEAVCPPEPPTAIPPESPYDETTDGSNSTPFDAGNSFLNRTVNDPCSNYTVLNESWRNVHTSQTSMHCDSLLTPGTWFRFMPPAGIALPETVPPIDHCDTSAPMWLSGAHPRNVSNVPVERQLCARYYGHSCHWSTSIQVALCSGGFYVYMAPSTTTPGCNLEFCAGQFPLLLSVDTDPSLSSRALCELQGSFYCSLTQICLPDDYRCNGVTDCIYGEDEAGCASSSTAPITNTTESNHDETTKASYSTAVDASTPFLNPTPDAASSSSCSAALYRSGSVQFTNYPSHYNNLHCNWTLVAIPSGAYIVLKFYDFNTESCCDFVSIYNSGGALVDRYSGNSLPPTMIFIDRAVVTFTTDGLAVNSGFSLWFASSVEETFVHTRDSCEHQGNFYCISSDLCVPMSHRCDFYASCFYGEDEAGCTTSTTATTALVTLSQRDSCLGQGNFYCEFSRLCISMLRRCDDYADCNYGEDESMCGTTMTTSRSDSRRTAASEQPRGSFIAASGFAQAFLQLGKSCASKLTRGYWFAFSGYVTALLFGPACFRLH